jgi:hypothetical protein
VLPVREAQGRRGTVDLLIVGGPTHVYAMATKRSRHAGAETAREDRRSHLDPGATAEPGLRTCLHDLSPAAAHHAVAFDTRLDKAPWISGAAGRVIARRLRCLGIDVIATESFLVQDTEGPLKAGELERAWAWGAELARSLPAPTKQLVEA